MLHKEDKIVPERGQEAVSDTRVWRSVIASEWSRVRRLSELFPWTPLGVLLTALAYAALEWLAYGQLDLVWLVVGYVGLGLTLLAPLVVLLAAAWLRIAGGQLDRQANPLPLRLETGSYFETGFRRPSLWFLPLVQVRWEWLSPSAEIEHVTRDGMLLERACVRERGEHTRIERRMIVSDAFGLSRVRFRVNHEHVLDVLPRVGALRTLPALNALASGDALPHPHGLTEGDRLELRRYAPGDPARFIHWKVLSRTGKLMVRVPERALSVARRMAAYVIAGEDDDASCGAARLAVEQHALGLDWTLGTDGLPAGTTRVDEALSAIVRSVQQRASAAKGLAAFVERVERGGPASYVLFVPPQAGAWMQVASAMARGRALRIVIAIDGLAPDERPAAWWRWVALQPPRDGVEPGQLAQLVAELSAAGASVSVLDRTTGRALSATHLQRSAQAQAVRTRAARESGGRATSSGALGA